MSFHEVQFPPDIAYGATGGPAYATAVVEAGGGFEKHLLQPRITPAAQPVKPVVADFSRQPPLTRRSRWTERLASPGRVITTGRLSVR